MASREQRQEAIRWATSVVRANRDNNRFLRAVASTVLEQGDLVSVEGVEIVQTGIEYPLASGPHTFTVEDLQDAVDAQNDPAIKQPRLRLGHEGLNDPDWDGEPAIGVVSNMRLEQSGHKIVGDYENIPEWLALALPSAYPGRSIDGEVGVVTNTGNSWGLVITGLALLGVRWPGVSTLEDIKALYGKEMPDSVKVYTTEEVDEVTVAAAGAPVSARIDVDVIRRQYYSSLEGSESWSMWIRGQYQDPDELIVEDESSGELYRVPYTISGQEVTFSDKVAVLEEFVDKPQKKEEMAAAVRATMFGINLVRKPTAVYASREESRKDIEVTGSTVTTPDPKALRALVGLGEDATDEALNTALEAAGLIFKPGQTGGDKAPGAESAGSSAVGAGQPGAPDVTGPSGSDKNDPAVAAPTQSQAAPVTAGLRTMDEATYQTLMAGAQAGSAALARFNNSDRDGAVTAAIQAGKIPKSREAHWKDAWDKDPEGTKILLTAAADKGGLAPGLIPVGPEVGGVPADGGDPNADDAYPPEWLPEVAARKAALAASQQGGVFAQPAHPNAGLMRRGTW